VSKQSKSNGRRGNGLGSLYKRGGRGNWRGAFIDADGRQKDRTTGTTDRAAAERILAKWIRDAQLRREGVIDSRAESLAAEGRRAIGEQVEAFIEAVQAKGVSGKRVKVLRARVARVIDDRQIRTMADLTAARVGQFVKGLQDGGTAARTVNGYLQAIKQFTRWAAGNGRIASDPLAGLSAMKVVEVTRERRPLAADELRRLIDAAAGGPAWMGLSGQDRAMLYRVATGTGFRAGELRSLTAGAFDLDAVPPAVTVRAAYTKNRREARQPIRADLAELLRPWLAGFGRDDRVFEAMPEKLPAMVEADLRRARIKWRGESGTWRERHERAASDFLRACDGDGRVVDFHALRATYITALVKGGASVKVAQELARHSDPKLTMNTYTRLGVHDLAGALDGLPAAGDDSGREAADQVALATGTDDAVAIDRQLQRSNSGAKQCDQASAACDESGNRGENGEAPKPLKFKGKSDVMRPVAMGGDESHRWDSNPRPVLYESTALTN